MEYDLTDSQIYVDYSLVEDIDIYIFTELEECSYAAVTLLSRRYPHKTIIMLDKRVLYFPELTGRVIYMEPAEMDAGMFYRKEWMWVTSDGVNHDFPHENFANIYNSINVLYSMLWCSKRECFGEKNKDCTIYLIDYRGNDAGLGDYIRFTYAHYLIARRHQWKICIDLSRQPNQYLMSETDNMWDYFFESLSDISREEADKSFSVIRASVNGIKMCSQRALPYLREVLVVADREVMKNIRFNENTRMEIKRLIPEKISEGGNGVLGVVLRGTDYREKANFYAKRNVRVAGLEKMIKKCKFIMNLYGYNYIFLATEDSEYYERMKEEFGDRCLSIEQKRGYHDYSSSYRSCAEILDIEDGKEFGRRYLAVIQSLADCRSLISNMYQGTTILAKSLNDLRYEYFEIVSP